MLSVNDVGRICEEREVVDDRHCRGAQVGRDAAQKGAVGDGLVTAPPQSDRQVPDVEFAPASIGKIGVGQEDTQVFILPFERRGAGPPAIEVLIALRRAAWRGSSHTSGARRRRTTLTASAG
jgi:hypothetical protein